MLTGARQVQDALRQVEAAEKSAQTATRALEQSSGQAATALTAESQAASHASQAVQQTGQASQQTAASSAQLAQAVQQANSQLTQAREKTDAARAALYDLEQAASRAGGGLASMAQQALAFGAGQLGVESFQQALSKIQEVLTSSVQGATRIDALGAAFKGITGSGKEAGEAMQFIRETAQRLGVEFGPLADGYKTIAAAARGTTLEGEQTKQAFLAIAEAGRVFQLSGQDMQGALLALGQMISKGTVQAEELRGQLGERLPGAFQIAARAMGVSTAELGKMLEQGQIVTSDFLPKFAAQMRSEMGGAVAEASQTAGAAFARFSNAISDLKNDIGRNLLPPLAAAAEWFAKVGKAALQASEDVQKARAATREAEAAMAGGMGTADILERVRLREKQIAAAEGYADEEKFQRQQKLREENAKDLATLDKLRKMQDEMAAADQPVSPAAATPGLKSQQAVQDTLKGITSEMEKINRQQQAGMPQLDAINAKIKVYGDALEKARTTLAAQPGTFALIQKSVQPAIDAAQKQLTLLENQKEAITGAEAAQRAADREREKAAREAERQYKKDLATSLKQDEPFMQQVSDAADLLGELQRRTERLGMTEEERFEARVKAMAEERPYLKEELEAALARYKVAKDTNDALKERPKLLQDQAQASKATWDDIQRLQKQLEPQRRTMSREEQLQQTREELARRSGNDPGTMARADEQIARTLNTERWQKVYDGLNRMADELTQTFVDMASTGEFSFKRLADSFTRTALQMVADALDIKGALSGWLKQGMNALGGGLGSLFDGGGGAATSGTLPTTWGEYGQMSAAGAFGGGMQLGGPVYSDRAYLVGERGPELFVPPRSGTIVPHGASAAGRPVVFNMTVVTPNADSFRQSENQLGAKMVGLAHQARRIL